MDTLVILRRPRRRKNLLGAKALKTAQTSFLDTFRVIFA